MDREKKVNAQSVGGTGPNTAPKPTNLVTKSQQKDPEGEASILTSVPKERRQTLKNVERKKKLRVWSVGGAAP